jgi:hypothetical protein
MFVRASTNGGSVGVGVALEAGAGVGVGLIFVVGKIDRDGLGAAGRFERELHAFVFGHDDGVAQRAANSEDKTQVPLELRLRSRLQLALEARLGGDQRAGHRTHLRIAGAHLLGLEPALMIEHEAGRREEENEHQSQQGQIQVHRAHHTPE